MEFSLGLVEADRPIVRLDNIFKGCTALIDTGALFPVWTKEEELLKALGANLVKKSLSFSGFGGSTKGNLYTISIKVGELIYPNMHIIACKNEAIPGFFIFSSTMFKGTIYTVDDINKKFVIETADNQVCRNISIKDNNGKLYVLYGQ
jgi:hypothetical protein